MRRLARLLVSDAQRADAAVLDLIWDCRSLLRRRDCGPPLLQLMMRGLVCVLEQDARLLNILALQGNRSCRPALLPAVWALSYEERLAVSLLFVEELSLGDAAKVSGIAPGMLDQHSAQALAKLDYILRDGQDPD